MPFITITYPPKYPLTESEKKWLGERKNLCDRCPKRAYCRTGKKHNFNTQDCRFWEVYAPRKDSWSHEVRENFKDAAEFEARVAAKLATMTCDRFCPDALNNRICRRGWADRRPMYACRLKRARLEVEEEMP